MSNLKTLVFIIHGLAIGGAEKFTVALANTILKKGHVIKIISLSENNPLANELNPKIELVKYPRLKKIDYKVLSLLKEFIVTKNVETVFCINLYTFLYIKLCLVFKKYKPEIIISYHTTIPANRKEYYLTRFYFSLLSKNDKIIAVSNNQAKYIIDLYKIDKYKVQVIQNGVDLNYWNLPGRTFNKVEFREQWGINPEDKVIVMTAGFRHEKNHKGALEALKILISDFNFNAKLLLVGNGALFEETKRYVDKLNLKDFVVFAGLQGDVRPFYWISDVFTLCSTSVETFSIAALEAMSCGLPCVLTNIGGANEMIEEGINGFLTDSKVKSISNGWNLALTKDFDSSVIRNKIMMQFNQEIMCDNYLKVFYHNK